VEAQQVMPAYEAPPQPVRQSPQPDNVMRTFRATLDQLAPPRALTPDILANKYLMEVLRTQPVLGAGQRTY
jgi:hypothetical protein